MEQSYDVHITDTVENLDLKIKMIPSKENKDKVIFNCYVKDNETNKDFSLILEEKIAALLYVGFQQIFIEDGTEYQTDTKYNPEEILQKFFTQLRKCDEEHFYTDYDIEGNNFSF